MQQLCPSVNDLAAYHSGQTDEAVCASIDDHLQECAQCRHVLEQMQTPTQVIHVASSDKPGSGRMDESSPEDVAQVAEDLRFPGPYTSEAPLGELLGYQILRKLGWGGGGLVYRARDVRLQREVALKFLRQDLMASPRERARFDREARALASVQHEHIVAVHDICFPEFFPPFLVLEYVGGDTLAKRLERDGAWQPVKAAVLVRNIAQALEVAHDMGLVHRDIKPSNILFDHATNIPKLIDFGLARPVSEAGELTQAGVVLGTPAYMSPEQISDPNRVDGRSDVYSLGIVLYEMLTGDVPFRGVSRMVLAQIEHDEPTPPRRLNDHIPRDLETIILKSLQKDPAKRYASATRLAEDLDRWLQGAPIVARPLGRVQRLARWIARHPGPAGLAVLLAGFLLLWFLSQRHSYDELKLAHDDTKKVQQLAQDQRDIALEALLGLVFEAQDQLQDQPGLDALRLALLHKALDGLQKVSRTSENADRIDQGTVTAHQRLGDVYLLTQHPDEARVQFEQAYKLAQRLLTQSPDNLQAHRAAVMALYRQGDVDFAQSGWEDAADRYEKARLHALEVARVHPGEAWLQQAQALIHERMGNCALETNQPAEARDFFAAALNHWQKASADSPVPAAWVKLHLAQALQRLGEDKYADDWARRGHAEIAEWARQHPKDRQAQRDGARAEALWADLLLKRNDLGSARAALDKADRLLAELLKGQPNVPTLRRERALVRTKLARLLERADQIDPAREHLMASWHVWTDLAQRSPGTQSDWKELILVEKSLMTLEAGAAKKEQARTWHQKARQHLDEGRVRFANQNSLKQWMDIQSEELENIRRKSGL